MTTIILPTNERWVVGFEGKYSIDENMQVWSYKNKKRKKIKTQKNGTVGLYDKAPITYSVCKLFREAFYPTPIGMWVEGFEGAYSVSEEGIVYSYKYGKPKPKSVNNGLVTLYCPKTKTNHTRKINKLLEKYKKGSS